MIIEIKKLVFSINNSRCDTIILESVLMKPSLMFNIRRIRIFFILFRDGFFSQRQRYNNGCPN